MIFICLNPLSSGNLQFVAQLWFYAQGRWLDKCISQGTWSEPSEANEQQFTTFKSPWFHSLVRFKDQVLQILEKKITVLTMEGDYKTN